MARSGRPPKIDPMKPIHQAVLKDDVATFSTELVKGDDINRPGPDDMTPLHVAALKVRVEFATALVDAGVDIDPINVHGNTPLWVAVMQERRTSPDGSMIRLLLGRGADPDRREGNNSPLELARLIAGFPEDLIAALAEKAQST